MLLLAILATGAVVFRADQAIGTQPEPGNSAVTVQLDPGPYCVGQGVHVAVKVPEGTLKPPAVVGGDLLPIPTLRPGEARFVLVPRRAGMLEIGSFRVLVGERLVGSKPTRIEVATIPAGGRTAAFLGGVGDFQVASQVKPASIKVGQSVEYRITITGPAAWGSFQNVPLAGLPTGLQVRQAAAELVPGEVPERSNRYHLRAIEPGRLVLPPVSVAAFDPRSGRFLTRSTSSQVVIVVAPPAFDPATVDLGPVKGRSRSSRRRWAEITLGSLSLLLGVGLVWKQRVIRRWFQDWQRGRPVNWNRQALMLSRWASTQTRDPETVGAEIVARLACAIAHASGQTLAVLTPSDAEVVVVALTGSSQVANRTKDLVAWCDRLRFDQNANATVGDLEEVVAEAVAILQTIGRHAVVRGQHPQSHRD